MELLEVNEKNNVDWNTIKNNLADENKEYLAEAEKLGQNTENKNIGKSKIKKGIEKTPNLVYDIYTKFGAFKNKNYK